jgi:hypothetical protein
VTALHSRAVITPAPGLDPIEFTHEGLTLQGWQGYARHQYGSKATVEVENASTAAPLPPYPTSTLSGACGALEAMVDPTDGAGLRLAWKA